MSSLYDFLNTELSSSATGGVNTAEGQDPSTVNDGLRQFKQLVAAFIDDLGAVTTVGGTADAITVTLGQVGGANSISAYATGQLFRFKAGADNTGAATLNVNAIGAKAIRKISSGADAALAAGDILNGKYYLAIYDATANTAAGAWIIDPGSTTSAATTTAAGIVELATQTEAATLTDTSRAITADGLFFLGGYTTTATAAGTTTLTVTSTFRQIFTGSTTQTLVLPVTSTLVLGRTFRVINNSTGAVTVQSSGANNILVVPAGSVVEFVCILTTGTTAASWDAKNVRGGLELLTSGTVSAAATLDLVLTSYTGYRGLRIDLINFIPATDNVDLWMRVSTDGGSSYDAGATDYWYTNGRAQSASATVDAATRSTGAAQGVLAAAVGNGTAEGVTAKVEMHGQTNTAIKPKISHDTLIYNQSDLIVTQFGMTLRNAAQDTNAIRFLMSSGNIASGTYAVYGYV